MDALPSEVISKLLSPLAINWMTLCTIRCVNRCLRDCASSESLWRRAFSLAFGHIPVELAKHRSWMNLFGAVRRELVNKSGLSDLAVRAVMCSSVDEQQVPSNVLTDESDAYWSTSGTPDQNVEEWIIIQLKQPVSIVRSVSVRFWAAWWLPERPVYSASQLQIEMGHTQGRMHNISEVLDVRASSTLQQFRLDAGPLCKSGEYLKVKLLGKTQMQLEDGLYYIVVNRITVQGKALPLVPSPMASAVLLVGLRQRELVTRLVALGMLPIDKTMNYEEVCGSCHDALGAIAELVRQRLRVKLVETTSPSMIRELKARLDVLGV